MPTIVPTHRTIKELLQGRSFSIDEYQREYKWETKHIEELISDLRNAFFSSYQPGHETKAVSQYREYFLGSIIVSTRDGKGFLVDGQQRVTSLTLLLIYLYRKVKGKPVAGTIAPLIHSDNLGQQRFNLDIPERIPVIQALFNEQPFNAAGKEESIRTICARFEDIERIDLADEMGDALPHFVYWLMTRVGLIEIATANDDYAQTIFEAMNDRGKPLSPVDMLKAYLLAAIQDSEEQRSQANNIWKQEVLALLTWNGEHNGERDAECIKAWFRAQHAESIRDRRAGATDRDWERVGTTFHRWARDNREILNIGTEAGNLALMKDHFPFFAKAFRQVMDASQTYTPGLESIFYNAHNEFTWQYTVLLAPLTVTDTESIVRKKLEITAAYLDIWLMRRVVNYVRVGYSSVSYAMYLLCKDIRRKSLDDLSRTLRAKLDEDEVTFDGYAQKDRSGVDGLGLNQFSRRYIVHLLARVTAFVDLGAGRRDSFPSLVDREQPNPFDVEHIWADDYSQFSAQCATKEDFENTRNDIAGLLLLPEDVNRSLQDKSFPEKAVHYGKQNFYAASLTDVAYAHQPRFVAFCSNNGFDFKPYAEFGKVQQRERREVLKKLIRSVWSPDRVAAGKGG